MPKSNNVEDKKRRTKKNNRKDTFKKYGKNTTRGMRIKQDSMEKTTKKKEGDNHIVAFRQQSKKNKGKHGASTAKNICKITCKNKK